MELRSNGFRSSIVFLLGLAVFINYVDRGILSTVAPLMKSTLNLTSTQFGVLTSAFFWTYVPSQIFAGWLAQRYNTHRVLALSLAAWAATTFVTGFSNSFAAILILRLLLGLGESAVFPCTSRLLAEHVSQHTLGAANAIISLGLSLGPAMGIFFGGLLMAHVGWRGVFMFSGALSLLWLIPWYRRTRTLRSTGVDASSNTHAPSFLTIIGRRQLWGSALGHIACNYGFYFVIAWMPLYLVESRGYSLAEMATVAGLVYLTFAAAAASSGVLVDRCIAAGTRPSLTRKTVGVVAFVGAAASLLVSPYVGGHAAIFSLFAAGASLGALTPHIFATGQILAGPEAAGKWMGLQNCLGNLSGIVGPIGTGMILDRTGSYASAFVTAAIVTASGAASWIVLIPKIATLQWKGSVLVR